MTLYQGLVSFHMQDHAPDWTRAAAALPRQTVFKSVDDVGMLLEAQRVNPYVWPYFRKWVDLSDIQRQPYDGASMATKRQRASIFFGRQVPTELQQVDNLILGLWNEVYAESHTAAETQDRIEQEQAFVYVWFNDWAHKFKSGTTLALSSAPPGNDIPVEVAAIAHEHDFFLDYHAYVLTWAGSPIIIDLPDGSKDEVDWRWCSGRWTYMDDEYRRAGYRVRWLFGEGGPIRRIPGSVTGMDMYGGWRHPDCCNGDPIKYGNIMSYWAERTRAWNRENGRRAHAVTLFTTKMGQGAPNEGWPWFKTLQPEMDSLAAISQRYAETTPIPDDVPVDPPPPDPDPQPGDGAVRLQVIAPAGVTIRTGSGEAVGALPVETRFYGRLLASGRYSLRGTVSADPAHVRILDGSPEPGPEPVVPVAGVDVSDYQGQIDWRLMKEQGVKAAYIKVTQGTKHVQRNWRDNHQWARAYGIAVGPYHYFNNGDDPAAQAAHFRAQAGGVTWELPYAGDFEDPGPGASATQLGSAIRQFLEAGGVQTVYTSPGWWNGRIGFVSWAAQYLLWLAHWDVAQPTLPAGWSDWWGWQYKVLADGTSYGTKPGPNGRPSGLDLDWFKLGQSAIVGPLTHWPVAEHELSYPGGGYHAGHEAVDLKAPKGAAIYAAAAGRVSHVGWDADGYGRWIDLTHDFGTTRYAHLERDVPVNLGVDVRGGQRIGTSGNTGNTFPVGNGDGSHLHFELTLDGVRVDPWPVLQLVQ